MLCGTDQCTGCGACYNTCPHNCIEMELNEGGVLYPIVSSNCVGCHECEKVCPILNDIHRKGRIFPKVYLAHSKDENIVKNAASGGIATVLNRYYIKDLNGYASGIRWDDQFLAVFELEDGAKPDAWKRFSHSKYVQSFMGDGYRQIKEQLDNAKDVFFCGLPCQIAGLYAYLGKEYDNLLTADIVCHGTSSSRLFQDYVEYMEQVLGKKIKKICQTDKEYGWNIMIPRLVCIETEDGAKHYYDSKKDSYLHMFLENMMFKPACYECKYQVMPRIGDITLGDFFGIGTIRPVKALNPNGESMVMVNTVKGQEAWAAIKSELFSQERALEEALYFNHNLWRSSRPHKKHEEFEKDMMILDYDALSRKYYSVNAVSILNRITRNVVKRILGLRLVTQGMLMSNKKNGSIRQADAIIMKLKNDFK